MSKNNFAFEIYGNSNIIIDKKPICMTFGNFDGVHLGHKYLIESMQKIAKEIPTVVVTFEPHSSNFFTPHNPKLLLTNLTDKISYLLNYGAASVIVQKFNEKFSQLSANQFCELWLQKNFNIHSVILGHDFCYGKNRQGNFSHMKTYGAKYGWHVEQIDAFKTSITNNNIVSSSFIREEITLGHIENAENLLGHMYSLNGVVEHGNHNGRILGFPTANLKIDCHYVIPKYGVYACYVELVDNPNKSSQKKFLPGVMNCGIRPSIGADLKLQIEAHILNFNEDIYDKKIKFYPKKYLRNEKKFNNLEELKKQITFDIEEAKKYFELNPL